MSKLDDLIRELCPDGVQVFRLEEIAHYAKTRIDCKTINEDNYVGVENLLQNKAGKTKATSVPTTGMVIAYQKNDILIGNIRPYLRKVWLADCEGGTNGDVLTVQIEDTEKVLPQFLYYVLSSEKFFLYDIQNSKGAKMPRGSKDAVMKFEVPLPPLEIQREIVRMLDSYTEGVVELQRQLTAELTARKAQYSYYRDKLLTFESRIQLLPLKDIAKFSYGYTDKAQEHGDTRFLRITDIAEDGTMKPKGAKYILLNDESKKYLVKKGDLLLARTGATYGKTLYVPDNSPAVYASFLIKIELDNSKISNRYYWHFSKSNQYWRQAEKLVSKGGQQQFNTNAVERVVVPVPPLDVQNRIVNVLDNFEKICSDLNIGLPAEIEARQKQYEYYRDKLLTFAENGNTILSRAEQSRAEQSRAEQSRAEQSTD